MEYHIIIKGRVQGVGFRYFTVNAAEKNGVKGWVKNKSDGSVEILAQAEENKLKSFIEMIKEGPATSNVSSIDISKKNEDKIFKNFRVVY